MAAFGLSAEAIATIQSRRAPSDFEVLPENETALDVFLRMATQWIVGPMGGAIGMNYASLRWVIETFAPNSGSDLVDDVQVMERAALAVINERKDG